MNSGCPSLIDNRTDVNGGRTSDRKHKLEVPEIEETPKTRKTLSAISRTSLGGISRSHTITAHP